MFEVFFVLFFFFFLPVYRKAMAYSWCVLFLRSSFLSLFENKEKSTKTERFFPHVCFLNSYSCKAFSLGMFARRCVFVNSVAPTDVLQVEWLWNELFIGGGEMFWGEGTLWESIWVTDTLQSLGETQLQILPGCSPQDWRAPSQWVSKVVDEDARGQFSFQFSIKMVNEFWRCG